MEALWAPDNFTQFSSLINVPAGKVAVLFAVGLKPVAYRTMDSIKRPQVVCVRRVLFGFAGAQPRSHDQHCCVYDVADMKGMQIEDEIVQTCGKPWMMSMCRNLACIPLPGIYRLELNDTTAIGEAQVYVEIYDNDAIPAQAKSLFFD